MLRGIVILAALNEETINTCLYVASEIVVILKMVRFLQQKKKYPKQTSKKGKPKKKWLRFSHADYHDLTSWKNVANSFPIKTFWFFIWFGFFLNFVHWTRGREVGPCLCV